MKLPRAGRNPIRRKLHIKTMNLENHETRIAQLEKLLSDVIGVLSTQTKNNLSKQQEMLLLLQLTQEQYESVISLYRLVCSSPVIVDEAGRQGFLDIIARMETKQDAIRADITGLIKNLPVLPPSIQWPPAGPASP